MIRSLLKWLVIASLVLLGVSLWRMHALPPATELSSSLLEEPIQTPLKQAAFSVESHGITYQVQPLYHYDLTGLVVSKHDANTWWDYLHREWNDSLNIVDLCVVWGNNVRSGSYADINFSSGQFTCNFSTNSNEAFAAFDQTAISNNHLLTDNPQLAKLMRSVQVGDQIHFRGQLAEYSHHHGFAFKRGTSITRTDTGNGACETVFIESFDILRTGGKPWRSLCWIAGLMLLFSLIAWFMQPVRFND
ncbi:hypothetical protein ACO0K3_05570 [Undibacterium sp. Rencai35W]|uniref:hypothetical protein n=1 Tax=Undibacterium sp. Rencai35W TaxID=3413046 RepID=UPI003BF3DC44